MNVDLDVVRSRRHGGDLDGDLVEIDCDDGREPEPRGSDGNHPGATTRVEEAPALEACEKLDAGARRRMRARAERPPGIDDHRDLVGRRWDPRRPDPEATGMNGTMELLPAILPAGLHGLGRHVRERRSDGGLTRVVGEDSELRRTAEVTLLEPVRETVEQPRRRYFHLAVRHPQRDAADPAQRSALFRRRKKPSSSSGFAA